MVSRHSRIRTKAALVLLLVISINNRSSDAFITRQRRLPIKSTTATERRVSASTPSSSSSSSSAGGAEDLYSFDDLLNYNEEIIKTNAQAADRADRETERQLNKKREQLLERSVATGCYRIQLPLVQQKQQQPAASCLFGMTIVQVTPGREVSEQELNLDTMRIVAPNDEFAMEVPVTLDNDFRGLLVKSVVPDSPAAQAGVQVGDVLSAVSATIGGAVWPTSTLQGVQSAISSRKLTSASVTLELRRLAVAAAAGPVVEEEERTGTAAAVAIAENQGQFELTLTRPLGFNIEEDTDGYVMVTGVHPDAPKLVQHAVQVGDRIVAVDSSLGDQLWPVSTVEGVIAAVTSRFPRQTITMRFERPRANIGKALAAVPVATTDTIDRQATTVAAKAKSEAPVMPVATDKKELLKRCRDVLRRYAVEDVTRPRALQKMRAQVADKVVDALARASATVDAVTLSMIMNAYLSCNEPHSAIRIFEAATGFAGDGSSNPAKEVIAGKSGGQILPTESALNLFTGTALLQAHAAAQDFDSVLRVLAALEGRSGVLDDNGSGLESAPWPWTGTYGSIQPDSQCYNIAISAAARARGSPDALYRALELFDRMSDAKEKRPGAVVRNEVTYNALISALCNAGRSDEAFGMFEQMKRAGLRPDKFTYTSLIKACVHDGDVEELLYDMRERGVKADVVTYNTIIRSLSDKRQWTQATRLVTEMESRGITPDSKTYSYLMNGMLKADKPSACLTLFESAYSNSRTAGLTENVYLYTTAITAASVLGDHERALELVSRMTANGVKPNLKTLTAVMGACLSSGKPDLAAQIYQKIDKPDGYAMSQGIRALCENGDLSRAAEIIQSQRRGERLMSGKEMMLSYKSILHAALTRKDYSMARLMLTDILAKGYIPSKPILFSIIESFDLNFKAVSMVQRGEDDQERFRYLLFVIDSLQKRNLPMESILYVATLVLGGQLGGRARNVASLMAHSRTTVNTASKEILLTKRADNNVEARLVDGWEEVLLNYDSYTEADLDNMEKVASLSVRVSPKDIGRVLRAEQSVTRRKNTRKRISAKTER